MTPRPDQTQPQPAVTPKREKPRRRRWWMLLIPLVIVVVPAVIIIALNTGDLKLPEIDEKAETIVNVRDMPALGRLNVEGIRRLKRMIAGGKPAMNPLTIVKVYWKLHRPASMRYEPETGHLMPVFDADAWAILTVPIKDSVYEYHAYHYVQEGNLAYLQGPEDGQVLIMPFTAADLHDQLAAFRKPFVPSEKPAAP